MISVPFSPPGKSLKHKTNTNQLTKQLSRVPPNVRFIIDNVEQPWAEAQPYDYIHCRYMAASIQDWPGLVKQCFDNVKPGGWVEFQDYDTTCVSQDNSMPEDYKVGEMIGLLRGALDSIGRLLDPGPLLKGWVEDAGFENISHTVLPLPVGIWPKGQKMVSEPSPNVILFGQREAELRNLKNQELC